MMEKRIQFRTPEELKKLTGRIQPETGQFLKKLERKKPADLDSVAHRLNDLYFSVFNCTDCANCCKSLGPRLSDTDIDRLSRFLKMKTTAFMIKFVVDDEDGDKIFNSMPCPFLQNNNFCSVYDSRPKACRDYPHTDKKRFYQVLHLAHKNAETCPVVYEIIKELKYVYKMPSSSPK